MVRLRSNHVTLIFLFLLLFIVYNLNCHLVASGDSQATKVLPLSLLQQGNLYVDQFASLYLGNIWGIDIPSENRPHFIRLLRGHWLSTYPVVIPILIAPLYAPLAWFLSHYQIPYDYPLALHLIDLMEKLSASLIASLSAIFLYLILCRLTRRSVAFGLTLIYALASNTWVIGSQALWQHGMSELLISLTLWLLLISDSSPHALIGAGLASSLAVANRPPNMMLVALLSLYILHRYRGLSWRFFLLPPFVATVYLLHNLYYFGTPTGEFGINFSDWPTPLREGLVGLLVSPSRGLFIYMPWTLFSCWGMVRVWRSSHWSPLFRYLSLGVIGETLLYAKWNTWWGGGCFGPRFLTDILPILTIFLLPVLQSIARWYFVKGLFATTIVFALGVQVLGAFFRFPPGPDRSKLWSWRESQLVYAFASLSPERMVFWDLFSYALDSLSSGSTEPKNFPGHPSLPKVFSVALLPSKVGSLVANPVSGQGYVRRAEKGQAGFLLYGPYLPLPPGCYQARFFLRALPTEKEEEIAILDVATKYGTQQLAQRTLVSPKFPCNLEFQVVILRFEVGPEEAGQPIEYRVVSTGKTLIEVERIEVWPDMAGKSTEGRSCPG